MLLVVLVSYLLGCFCTAYYLVRWQTGQDIRKMGSGTAGARNAGRVLGKRGFVIAFWGDVLKGAVAIWLAQWLGVGSWGIAAVMVAVVLGHLYPIQLGYQGGKGVATGFGAVLVLNLALGVLCVVLAAVVFAFTRAFTRSGLIAIAIAPLLGFLLRLPIAQWSGLVVVVFLLLYAHRAYIQDEWAQPKSR